MEVGAVKQAFNNELILLKKKLNQAKIQIIHKLTRKAKTLVEKKAPEPLKEKFKRKAELAINEVLLTKKIKARDIGKFTLTHKGKLQDYLNRPQVDQEKACARLLLHKVLQDKYKFIRGRFSGVPINDLFMSRLERQKMKKEAREKQKEKLKKKKGKDNIVNAEGDWNVEDINMGNNNPEFGGLDNELDVSDCNISADEESSSKDDDEQIEPGNDSDEQQPDEQQPDEQQSDENQSDEEPTLFKQNISEKNKGSSKVQIKRQGDKDSHSESEVSDSEGNSNDDGDEISNKLTHIVKRGPVQHESKFELKIGKPNKNVEVNTVSALHKLEKKQKDSNKNKNFNEKILNRKFKKDSDDTPQKEVKIVDPFFITSTGENYMSLAEPRAPDEVKEFHQEGNRKLRRAVMFGHVPKIKPRHEFRQDNEDRFNRHNRQNSFDKRSDGFDRQNYINDRFNRKDKLGRDNFKDSDRRFNKKDNFEVNKFRDTQRTNFNDTSAKPEKLHPSWEAKKRQSGILPFEGKKVVFNDD